jgi:hypothetical protein
MPRTILATEQDISIVKVFNAPAATLLLEGFNEGKKIEKVESSFSDPGDDYVKFLMEGKEVCHIPGY